MPPNRVRYALALTPLLVLFAFGFGAYQLYMAALLFRAKAFVFGAIYCLMGVGGVALGIALWRLRKKFRPPED